MTGWQPTSDNPSQQGFNSANSTEVHGRKGQHQNAEEHTVLD